MKDGRITQDGKYNDILKSGSDFMELVGAHKEALSALDSIEAGAAVVGEDSSTGNAKNFLQKKESPTDQNDKTDNAMGTNGQLIQANRHGNLLIYGKTFSSLWLNYFRTTMAGWHCSSQNTSPSKLSYFFDKPILACVLQGKHIHQV
ncbi:ABC transporter C family member 3-like [Forsythia ovata]|uniref:ABC transporter C family member 3-like n=1 Tax=Forsythia ovata TaxID=205694 RepID=A0ABD1Q916_9LAMI